MNTQFILSSKAALAASILSAAAWLPLAAQAQDLPSTTGHMPATHMRMENQSHHHAMHNPANSGACRRTSENPAYLPESGFGGAGAGAGFAETDPASLFTPDSTGSSQFAVANVRIRQIPTGFAETDPAAMTPVASLPVSKQAPGRIRQTLVGFAETDPAASTYRSGVDVKNRQLAVCPHVNGELSVQGVTGGMMGAGRMPGHS